MLSWYRTLLAHRPLLSGGLTWVDIDLPERLAFERDGALVVANVGGDAFDLPADLVAGRSVILCVTTRRRGDPHPVGYLRMVVARPLRATNRRRNPSRFH